MLTSALPRTVLCKHPEKHMQLQPGQALSKLNRNLSTSLMAVYWATEAQGKNKQL